MTAYARGVLSKADGALPSGSAHLRNSPAARPNACATPTRAAVRSVHRARVCTTDAVHSVAEHVAVHVSSLLHRRLGLGPDAVLALVVPLQQVHGGVIPATA